MYLYFKNLISSGSLCFTRHFRLAEFTQQIQNKVCLLENGSPRIPISRCPVVSCLQCQRLGNCICPNYFVFLVFAVFLSKNRTLKLRVLVMAEEFAYIPYLSTIQQLINMICMTIAIVLFANLLAQIAFGRKSALRGASGSLIFYMMFHLICTISAYPCIVYRLLDFIKGNFFHDISVILPSISALQSPDRQLHKDKPDQLGFFFNIFSMNYIFVASIPTLFLTLDRCLVLKFKWTYTKSLRKQMLIANCFVTCCAYLTLTTLSMRELPLQLNKSNLILPCAN